MAVNPEAQDPAGKPPSGATIPPGPKAEPPRGAASQKTASGPEAADRDAAAKKAGIQGDPDDSDHPDTSIQDLSRAYEDLHKQSAESWIKGFETKHGALTPDQRDAVWEMKAIIDKPEVSSGSNDESDTGSSNAGGFAGLDKNPALDRSVKALQESIFSSWKSQMDNSFSSLGKVAKKGPSIEIA